jgi:hypothetical protein
MKSIPRKSLSNKRKSLRKRVKNALTQMLPEKTIDTGGVLAATATGTFVTIAMPTVQGVSNGQRTGDEIFFRRLEFHSTMYYGDPAGNVIRIIMLQVIGSPAAFLASDLLSVGSSGFIDVNSFYVPFNNGKRFKVLYDEKHIMIPQASNSTISCNVAKNSFVRMISFTPGGTFVETGQPLMFVISDSGILPNPSLDYVFRLYYKDI